MKRADAVIVYNDGERLKCRICCGDESRGRQICHSIESHICCSYGSSTSIWTQGFHFDNTKHRIILSMNICRICVLCNGVESCIYNITAIREAFSKKIESVEERE